MEPHTVVSLSSCNLIDGGGGRGALSPLVNQCSNFGDPTIMKRQQLKKLESCASAVKKSDAGGLCGDEGNDDDGKQCHRYFAFGKRIPKGPHFKKR